jgi:fermentation-respiration switch protein FrsA (DUF1100 family)
MSGIGNITRRSFIAMAGITGAAFLTGCASSSGTNGTVVSSSSVEDATSTAESNQGATEGSVTMQATNFPNADGLNLAADLFLPPEFDENQAWPAVVVCGPMLSVKEQTQSLYAQHIAQEGYVTMVFDYTYFGGSEGQPRQYEVPDQKARDISSAIDYLETLPYVDASHIAGMGICGSGSYMPYAALSDPRIAAVISVVPGIVTLDSMMQRSLEQVAQDRETWEAGGEPTYIDLMPRSFADGAAYYYNSERNTATNWSNLAVSWSEETWVDFDMGRDITTLTQPYLVITGSQAWSRSVAQTLYDNATSSADRRFHEVEGAGHFDLYDLDPYFSEAMDQIVPFLSDYLSA